MDKRLMGIENEIGLSNVYLDELDLFSERFLSLIEKIDSGPEFSRIYDKITCYGTTYYWFINGGKAYKDSSHLEYATAECASVRELTAQDKAFEKILRKMAEAGNFARKIAVIKNNASYESEVDLTDLTQIPDKKKRTLSWGFHENYLLPASLARAQWKRNIMPHLMARKIFTGSGHIHCFSGGPGWRFVLSSRATALNAICKTSATQYKPFILERNEEAHADSNLWQRLQITSSEANMLELPTFLKFMTTHLCFRLIEDGWEFPKELTFCDYLAELAGFNADIYLRGGLKLNPSKRRRSALSVERLYLKAAKKLQPLSDEEKTGLELWEWVLDLLSSDLSKDKNLVKLFGILDWPTKWYIVKREAEKNNLPLGHPKILGLNLSYHSLAQSPKESLWAKLLALDKEKPFMHRVVSEEMINKSVTEPPPGRAKIRSDFIKFARKFNNIVAITNLNWHGGRCTVNGLNSYFVVDFGNTDPFNETNESFEKFKQAVFRRAFGER